MGGKPARHRAEMAINHGRSGRTYNAASKQCRLRTDPVSGKPL
jgi:hypothetical protein